MLYRYVGEMTDSVAFNETNYHFNPQSEIELPDNVVEFPYVARMVQNGLLKAISRPRNADALAPAPAAVPAPAPAPEVK